MRAWFEVGVQGRATGFLARLLECENFGVFHSVILVNAGANNISSAVDNDCAHTRVGRS